MRICKTVGKTNGHCHGHCHGHCTGTVRALYGHCRGSGKNSIPIFFLLLCVGKVLLYIYSLSQLSSNSPNKKMKTHPRQKNKARVEPGPPDGLPLSKIIEEVGIIIDSPTNMRTWPSTYRCRPGTLKSAQTHSRVACLRRCATPVPPLPPNTS